MFIIFFLLVPLILELGIGCTIEFYKENVFLLNSKITDDSLKYIKNLDDDDWEYVATFSEEMVFVIPKLYSVAANNFIEFSKTQLILFEKIFILKEVATFDNIAVLSEMFHFGHAMQGAIDQIKCLIFRKREEHCEFDH